MQVFFALLLRQILFKSQYKCKGGRNERGYFNHQQVEVEGVRFCENNHPKTEIVPAWEVEKVKVEILDQSSEQGFFGVLAFLNQKVVGFAWARVILFPEVRKHWGDKIIDKVQPYAKTLNLVYFDELAVDLKKRNKGLGKEMVVFVCRWAKQEHPDDMTLLRTHKDSPAKHIYESIGYIIFADDTEYGGGRVMMKADRCRDLNVTVQSYSLLGSLPMKTPHGKCQR